MRIVAEVVQSFDFIFGEGSKRVEISLTGDPAFVEAAKHAAISAIRELKKKMIPEAPPCRSCGDR